MMFALAEVANFWGALRDPTKMRHKAKMAQATARPIANGRMISMKMGPHPRSSQNSTRIERQNYIGCKKNPPGANRAGRRRGVISRVSATAENERGRQRK